MSLGTMVLATLFADLLAWTLVVTGVEHFAIRPGITATNPLDLYDYPISHSLATDVLWGTLLAAIYYLFRRYWRGTVLVFFLVISHGFLISLPIVLTCHWRPAFTATMASASTTHARE
jgi:hypothetical protein